MATTYDVNRGFDFVAHWLGADYIVRHGALPPLDLTAAAYHPPLYYLVLAAMIKVGLGTGAAGWLAALLGIARLVVVWVALERWLPESRLARVVALFTAAVIPVGVQLDGMVTNETLSTLVCALAILDRALGGRGGTAGAREARRLVRAVARAGVPHQVFGVGDRRRRGDRGDAGDRALAASPGHRRCVRAASRLPSGP